MGGKYLIAILMLIILIGCKGQIKAEKIQDLQPTQDIKQVQNQTQDTSQKETTKTQKTAKEILKPEKKETETKDCKPGEELKEGKCTCKEGYRFCETQNRCIKENSCCKSHNCRSFEYCVPTKYTTNLCIKKDNIKMCKSLTEDRPHDEIEIQDKRYEIEVTQFLEGKIKFKINNKEVELKPQTEAMFEGMTIWTDGLEEAGGYCREETD